MTLLRQPPITAPVSIDAVLRSGAAAAAAPLSHRRPARADRARMTLAASRGARAAVLVDSGTSALVLALRLLLPRGGTVALPAYACVDLGAAAVRAGMRIRLYDLDPGTLAPDAASLAAAIARGVDAVVVAHLFGVPVDLHAFRRLPGAARLPFIEDAAQGSGASVGGVPAGGLGDLSIVSFGRGKGVSAGGGGALLASRTDLATRLHDLGASLPGGTAGWRNIAVTLAQWALARSWLYSLPASVPQLRLGEMVYHAAGEPRAISEASAVLLTGALRLEPRELEHRRAHAAVLREAALAGGLAVVTPLPTGTAGWLRFPVLVDRANIENGALAPLGIVRPYPRTLDEEPAILGALHQGERAGDGSRLLARALLACPTHGRLSAAAVARLARWLRAGGAGAPTTREAREPRRGAAGSAAP